jgi:hypothetical protein
LELKTSLLKTDDTQRMKKIFPISLVLLLSTYAQAQVASTFDASDEGWTAKHSGGTLAAFSYSSSGGNPGGSVSASPPTSGGTVNISMTWYWEAPAAFLGDHDLSYGQLLKFDLIQSVAGTDNTTSDVVITSAGGSIHYTLPSKPGTGWTSYAIPLDLTADWRWGSKSGTIARHYQIKRVLADITKIQIRCKYSSAAGYATGIDNVVLETKFLAPAPTISSFSPLKGLPGTVVTIQGSGFNMTPAKNIVTFAGVRAITLTSTGTTLTVKVPESARRGPIMVNNTELALVGYSSKEFQPLFDNGNDFGGRIIPSSFGDDVKIPIGDFNDNGIDGANLADLDGDGLLDVVTLESAKKFALFRNLGLKGMVSQESFAPKMEIPSGELGQGNSGHVEIADFDNDGKNDIATFSRGRDDDPIFDGGIAVTRNISTPGNLNFETAERFYFVTISCSDIASTDVDGDGRIDLLVTSGGFRIAKNISTPGNIEFATMHTFDAANGTITYGDLNGDSKPDIIVTGVAGGGYLIFENQSIPGTIQFATPIAMPGSIQSGVTISDLDNDEKPDLLFYRGNAFNDYSFVIKKNIHTTGPITAASFEADIIFSTIGRAYSQTVADFNGDARPEILIIANSGSAGNGFIVFENKSQTGVLDANSFGEEVYFEETTTGTLSIPQVGDIDGDNKPDVVAFGSSDGGDVQLTLYRNECYKRPHIALHTVSPLAGPIGSTVTITGEDFSTDPSKLRVRFGAVEANIISSTLTEIKAVVPAGATYDLVSITRNFLTSRYHLPFAVTFSTSAPTLNATSFLTPVDYPLTGADYDVEIGDMNGDGKPDILAESFSSAGSFQYFANAFMNENAGGDITNTSFSLQHTAGNNTSNPRLFDIDEDGKLDIVSSSIHRNISTGGVINFDAGVTGVSGIWPAWGDFDLDGKTDIIMTSANTVRLARNHSRPRAFRTGSYATFGPSFTLTKPANDAGVITADFDNDGNTEFASTNPATDNIRIWRNAGGFPLSSAQFSLVGDIAAGDNPGRLYAGDVDVDGKIDMVVYHSTGADNTNISVFHNTSTIGNITFVKHDYALGVAGTTLAIADLNGDGKPEILLACQVANAVKVFENNSNPGMMDATSFTAPVSYTVPAPRGITAGDLNGDGKPEIIVTRLNTLSILPNGLPSGPTITIDTQPKPAYVCEGKSITLIVDASGTTNIAYQWQKFDGSNFIDLNEGAGYSGTSTKTITINTSTTGSAGNGEYRVRINGDLAPEVFSSAAALTINNIPIAPDAVGSSACVSPSTVTLTATGAADGDYNWYDVAAGGSALGTNGSFTTPPITATKTFYVSISDTFCESERVPVNAVIALLSKPTLTSSKSIINGNVDICDGDNCTLTAPPGFKTYTWSTGATGEELVVGQSGSYTVVVKDINDCVSPASDPITVTENLYPVATIAINGVELTTSPGDSYQWYQNGSVISGAVGQSIEFNVLEYGTYAVDVTENGCTTTSNDFEYLITDAEQLLSGLKVYPNPARGDVLSIESAQAGTITILDTTGKLVHRADVQRGTVNSISLNKIARGTYLVRIYAGEVTQYIRLVRE